MKKTTLQMTLVSLAVIAGVSAMFDRSDPASGEPRIVEIAMQMTVKDFIVRNGISIGPHVAQSYAIDADKLTDWMPIQFDDNWIELRYLEDGAGFELPPGRVLQVSQQAGRINGFAMRPFAQPLPLEEIRGHIEILVNSLRQKGWRITPPLRIPSSPQDFDSNGKSIFAELVSPDGNTLQMNLRDYGLAPRQESYILQFNPFRKPAAATHTYLLQVTVDSGGPPPSYGELVFPRRLFVYGDINKQVPLRLWIDDPNWSPKDAGMIPTTPEERSSPDSSNWKVPGR